MGQRTAHRKEKYYYHTKGRFNFQLQHQASPVPTLFKLEKAIQRKKLIEVVSCLKTQTLVLNDISDQKKQKIQELVLSTYQNPADEKKRDITQQDEELIIRSLIRSGMILWKNPKIPPALKQQIEKHSKERLLEITHVISQTLFKDGLKPVTGIIIDYLKTEEALLP